MPYFIVQGRGKDSGRKRKPIQIFAKDRNSAIAKAKKQGIVPEAVVLVQVTHFLFDVAGISHRNRDGTERQAIVKRCRAGETLVFEHEVDNPHDVHATTISRENGEQLGYVPAVFASQVTEWHRMNCRYSAAAVQTVPLGENRTLCTVQVCVFLALPDAASEGVTQYVSETLVKVNPQWRVERLLPSREIGSRRWVPMRQSPRDSSGRFSYTGRQITATSESHVRQRVKDTGKNGCLLLAVVLAGLGYVLSVVGTSLAQLGRQVLTFVGG
ncbi:MAG: HIRAN domain-containing protein [Sedimentisphaerales bacterium]|nr:HIRAN domain-containing protein [Sedimentisphaerales bacterium]